MAQPTAKARHNTLGGPEQRAQHWVQDGARRAGPLSLCPSPDDSPGDPLLVTKLSSPPIRHDAVVRRRLTERLRAGLGHKLTLISAPAGFGKTTLLSQWIKESERPVAWVSLDAGDDDPVRFWGYVTAAIRAHYPALGDLASTLLPSLREQRIESFLTVLTNELATAPGGLIVVLDDYHMIEDRAIHQGLAFLLDHLPAQVHLVIATRADPPLPLARLRGHDLMTELRAADLSFNTAETAAFLNDTMRLAMLPEDVAALEARTEGWIAGLQMAGLMARGCPDLHSFAQAFAGDHRYIIDYLLEEVLSRQPQRVQTFLLQTAILDRLSGPLCEAVVGLDEGEGAAMLELLEHGNLFTTPLDNQRRWYRYHYLFAGCLRTRLHRLPKDQLPELHRRACAWYVSHGMASEAVHHALAANAPELAAELIDQAAPEMLNRGEAIRFLGWLRALPDGLVRTHPRLCICHAKALLLTGQLDAAEARLDDAERCLGVSGLGRAQPAAEDTARQVLGDILTLRATVASKRRDVPLTIALSNQALSLAIEHDASRTGPILHNLGNAYRWTGDLVRASETLAEANILCRSGGRIVIAVLAASQLGSVQAKLGRLRQAAITYEQALRYVSEQGIPQLPEAAWLSLGLASLHYEWNDLSTAANYAHEGLRLANLGGLNDARLLGEGLLARLKDAQGDREGALATMRSAERLASAHSLPYELARLREYQVRLWLSEGNLGAALEWARASGLSADDEPTFLREAAHQTLARVLIAQGKAAEALPLLGRMRRAAEAAGRTGSAIKILTLSALAMQAVRQTEEALLALERALWLAEPERYVRTFVDAGKPVAALMAKLLEARQRSGVAAERGVSSSYVRALLAAAQQGSSPVSVERAPCSGVAVLSERELEVLRLVAAGRPPVEIASELVLSMNTVKTHLKRIYGKLEAHSGTEAVARARQIKIL